MKSIYINLLFVSLLFLMATNQATAQGATCQTADPFCSNSGATFPAGTNQPAAPLGNNYDCLGTQPNPAWYYLQINQSGNLIIDLSNSNTVDIDFIIYGPFTSLAAAQAQCGGLGNGGASGNVIDCSYSASAFETVDILGATTGQVYLLLITNFSNQPTNITANQSGGTGSTNCSILLPCATPGFNNITTPTPYDCNSPIVNLTANPYTASPGDLSITPGFYFQINTDAFSATQNTLTVFGGPNATGPIIAYWGPTNTGGNYQGPLPNSAQFIGVVEYLNPGTSYSMQWCDSGNSGTFQNEIRQSGSNILISNTPLTGSSVCVTRNLGTPTGVGVFSGPGVVNNGNGTGTFNAALAGAGVHTIEYRWNSTDGCLDSTEQTVVVCCDTGYTIINPQPDTVCQGSSTVLNADLPGGNSPRTIVSNATTQNLPANGYIRSSVTVSNVAPLILSSCSIDSVCFTINSNPTANLNIFLISPSGDSIDITSGNGGFNTTAYNNTCFSPNAVIPVTNFAAPFSPIIPANSLLLPEQSFNLLNTGNSNGTWFLAVRHNTAIGAPATFVRWSLHMSPSSECATYTWAGPNLSCTTCPAPTASPTVTSDYSITVVDGLGCTFRDTVTVVVEPTLPAPVVSCTNVTSTSVSFSWNAIAGAPGYEVSVDSGLTFIAPNGTLSHTVGGLTPNTSVQLIVRATGGTVNCPNQVDTIVCTSLNCPLTSSIQSQSNVSCNAGANGSVTININNEIGALSYQQIAPVLGVSQASPTFTGLTAGVYTFEATDATLTCSISQNVTITEPSALSITTNSVDVLCNGTSTGSATATPTGGTAPYTFSWSNGQNTATANNLAAGNYAVIATDANGCTISASVTITEPSAVTVLMTAVDASCFGGSNGTADAAVSGGVGPYSFNWNTVPVQNTATATGLAAGSYTVTVLDNNGCQSVHNISVGQPTAIILTTSTANALCFGSSDGTATVNGNGGTGALTFLWPNTQTTATATGLTAGTYCVTATDANACTASSCATVGQPTAIGNAVFISTPLTCSYNTDGTLRINVLGGTPPYNYLWSNGQNTQTATGLSPGNYSVTVTDANGCQYVDNSTVQSSLPLNLLVATNDVNCRFGSDGNAFASVSGGVLPYLYNWSNGNLTANNNNIPAGLYTVTVTDFNGCTIVNSGTVNQPAAALSVSISTNNNASCFGASDASLAANVSGGTPGYNFLWYDGQNTSVANGLPAGLASITVTDFNGCSASASANITQPSQILANVVQFSNYNGAAITCPGAADGALQVFANGGALPYSFNWSGPQQQTTALATGLAEGTYYVTVTDATGCFAVDTLSIFDPVPLQATVQQVNPFCNADCDGQIIVTATPGTGTLGINGYEYRIFGQGQVGGVFSANNNFLGLCNGTYTVEIRDGNNCVLPLSITLTEPAPLTISASFIPVVCNGTATGNATANAGGGVAPYSFAWSNGQTGQTAIGLTAGGYGVTVTDANGCTRATNIVVTQPSVLGATTTFTRPSCFGSTDGSASVTPTGGVAPYSFAWSTGAGAATALGLPAGTYNVTVTDAGGCAIVRAVTVTQPSQLALSVSGTNLTCAGNGTGSATVAIAGGTAPYTILWSNGATTATVSGLGLGIFSVVVTDANGCQQSTQLALTQPNPVVASLVSTTNVSCFGGSNGTATITANGGVPPYRFSWPNGQTTATATGLAAGTYTATVTDNNGCSSSVSMQITQPALLTVVQVTTTTVSCRGGSNGTASAFIQGGSSPYNFTWSNGGSGQSISNLAAGTYFLTVTDGNGCRAFSQAIVTQPASNLVGFINTTPALCLGAATGEMTAIISGGTVPVSGDYTYVWSNGASTAVVSNVAAGNYSVTVTDANGCSISLSATVGQAGNLNLSVVGSTPATCPGANNGTAAVTANGGTGTLSFQWSNGQNTPNATGLAAGVYTVTVTDANGCSQNTSVTVTEGAAINLVTAVTDVRCFGESNGRLDVTSSNISLYFWSTGQVGNPLSNLPAGQYTLTVVDVRGCSTTAVYNIAQPDELLSEITTINPVLCHNGSTANLSASAAGGIAGYSFNWSNAVTAPTNSNIPSGNYTVTITDANGCRSVSSVSLANPTQLNLSVSTVDVRCTGDENGSIIVNGSGGTSNLGAYEYSIDSINWQTGDLFPGLGVDSFRVYVRDANGCITEESAVIEAAEPFFITFFSPQDTTIEYGDTISLSVTLNDNSGASFSWTDVNAGIVIDTTNFTISVFPANEMVYEFSATSPLGCQVDTTVIISVTKPRPAAAPGGFTPNGDGTNDVFFIQGDNRLRSVNVFRVYDRWGECVFIAENVAANDPASGWDGSFKGEKMNSGTYSWYAEVEYIDGFKEIIRGDITLLR